MNVKAHVAWCCLVATVAFGAETVVLPKGAFLLDLNYLRSNIDTRWGNNREARTLLEPTVRYEPGGGLQGTLTARPEAIIEVLPLQLSYGLTEQLTLGVALPINLRSTVVTNLGWTPGDYQSQLGRSYSADDFWQWAESMGQPRPPDSWVGNQGTLADAVAVARYRLPRNPFTSVTGIQVAPEIRLALPTGTNPDPEELVTLGTNTWELQSFGDLEARLNLSRALWTDRRGVERFTVSSELFYGWLRPRTYESPRGEKNPLLLTLQPYLGDSYSFDPGDWLSGSLVFDFVPLVGPAWATLMSGYDRAKAEGLPPIVTLTAGYQYVSTMQGDWQSPSEIWNWEKEKLWRPGDKHIFRAMVNFSFLRLGLPLQVYGSYRTQEILPGRNTNAPDALTLGLRVLGRL